MSRPLRIEFPGAFYHVTSRGNERKMVFQSMRDRERYLSYLESAHDRYGAVIHVYCLMGNHYHLLLETPRGNLSQVLHHRCAFNNLKRSSMSIFDHLSQHLSRFLPHHLEPLF